MSVFKGTDGVKPSTEARRYVYRMAAAYLGDDEALMISDFDEFDRRRVVAAAAYVAKQLRRKAGG
jgi:hypothetical protein